MIYILYFSAITKNYEDVAVGDVYFHKTTEGVQTFAVVVKNVDNVFVTVGDDE